MQGIKDVVGDNRIGIMQRCKRTDRPAANQRCKTQSTNRGIIGCIGIIKIWININFNLMLALNPLIPTTTHVVVAMLIKVSEA